MGTHSTPEDCELDRLSGDPERFESLVLRYQAPLFRFAARIGINRAEAEDFAQEVFLRVWTMRDRYDPSRARLSTWFWTVARNLALNRLQVQQRRSALDDSSAKPETAATIAPGPAQQMYARDRLRQLDRAIVQLPASDRLVIALSYVEELSMADAARVCDCSTAAFRVRLSRVRRRLIEQLNESNKVANV